MRLIDADIIIARCETIERNNELSATEANRLGWLKEMIQMMPTATDVAVQSLEDEVEELKSENKKLDEAPTIDPVWQPHAMWINQDVRHMGPVVDLQAAECSACGRWLTTPYLYSFKHYEYCPYCGAKMDRGDEYETD